MTLGEIKKRVQEIKDERGDDEAAHVHEDQLREDFIEYIATLEGPIADKAKEVLKTNNIEFDRWCA
jgi:hypothetical protein